ncbi:hypothetical protein AQAU111925_06995 [Aquirufa aurantiipilula]
MESEITLFMRKSSFLPKVLKKKSLQKFIFPSLYCPKLTLNVYLKDIFDLNTRQNLKAIQV